MNDAAQEVSNWILGKPPSRSPDWNNQRSKNTVTTTMRISPTDMDSTPT